ncbi:MAG: hypothetical protein PSU94_05785 [Lacunisphaera sp.]|nr:hypothetical protein [Lacunisphaera sp.]
MRILAIERELSPVGAALPPDLLRQEAADVWALRKQGVIRDIWFTQDRHAVIMLECPHAAEARRHLGSLPLAQAGLIDFIVHELTSYDAFERLFTSGPTAAVPKAEEPPEY